MLLLSSPAGIALSTNEDIYLSADGQINQLAGDSINLSTQKNLIAHVSGKASLFAAQNGIKQVAAKGKFEVQALLVSTFCEVRRSYALFFDRGSIFRVIVRLNSVPPGFHEILLPFLARRQQ